MGIASTKYIICFFCYFYFSISSFNYLEAKEINKNNELTFHTSLKEDTMLHPGDNFTAYTYRTGEISLNHAFGLLKCWGFWGITDWFSTELDFEAWLGGIISVNMRFMLYKQEGIIPTIAYETMFQYLPHEIDLVSDNDYLAVLRNGSSWYNRINMSLKMPYYFYLHLSLGFTFSEYLIITNKNRPNIISGYFENCFEPDISCGVGWIPFDWMSVHLSFSYGSTFLYLDNVPRKFQACISAQFAPLIMYDIWYLNRLRCEIPFLFIYFHDADELLTGTMPFIYWQIDLY